MLSSLSPLFSRPLTAASSTSSSDGRVALCHPYLILIPQNDGQDLAPAPANAEEVSAQRLGSLDPDDFALVLSEGLARQAGINMGDVVHVNIEGDALVWEDAKGQLHQLAGEDRPMEERLRSNLCREAGTLVLFMDLNSGDPRHWAVFKASTSAKKL